MGTRFLAPPAPAGLEPGPPPRISIVIPAYQAAATVGDAVRSALTQSVPAHEVIVVDDGSSDGIAEALARYRERIVYIEREHAGTSATLNAGFEAATGDFAAILDADDVYERRRIEAMSELAAARPDLDILMTDAYLEARGEIVGRYCARTPFATTRQNVEIYERCFVAWPAVRRDELLRVGGFNESLRVGHDWECWIRLLHAGCRAGLVDEPLMRYRIGEQSLTADRVGDLRDRVRILELASGLDLSDEERAELTRFLLRRRRRALLAEAEQALRGRTADARRRALSVAWAPGMRGGTRLRALAAALAPRAAARRLERREAATGQTRVRRRTP